MNRKTTQSQNLWSRLLSRYRSLAPELRRLGVGFLATAAVGLCYWTLHPDRVEWAELLGGKQLSKPQLQSFCRVLEAEGLTAFDVHGGQLRVPRAEKGKYAAALEKQGLLRDGLYTAFDQAVQQTSWWTSSLQQDRNWELARQKFLAQMIEQMLEVERASVLIDRSRPKGLRGVPDIRGTVTVQTNDRRELPAYRIGQIRSLVAGAVAALHPENVTVVDLTGKAFLPLGSPGVPPGDLLEHLKAFEGYYTQKIYGALSYIPEVLVTVNVELAKPRVEPEKSAEGQPSAARPQAVVDPNLALSLPEIPPRGSGTGVTPPMDQNTWQATSELVPKNVTVAIAVPEDVVTRLLLGPDGSSAASAEWSERIKEQVAHAIPAGVHAKISVQSYPRNPEHQSPVATVEQSALKRELQPWIPGAAFGVLCALVPMLAILKWRGARGGVPPGADRSRAYSAGKPPGHELVRIERAAPTPVAHLAQADITNFEDLRRLAPASLYAVVRLVESRLWVPALRGASRDLVGRILTHLPARTAALLREEIDYPGPVRLGDVEAAQQEVLEVVRRLDHNGDLVLEDREEVRGV